MRLVSQTSIVRLVLSGALLLCSLIAFGFVMYEAASARTAAVSSQASLKEKKEQVAALERAAAHAKSTEVQRKALMDLAIPPGGGADFIETLEKLGVATKVPVEILSLTATEPKDVVPGILNVSLHFRGTYAAVTRLIKMIETLPRAVLITGIEKEYDAVAREWRGTIQLSALSFDTP